MSFIKTTPGERTKGLIRRGAYGTKLNMPELRNQTEKWLHDLDVDWFVTLNFNEARNDARAKPYLKHYLACVDRALLGPHWQRARCRTFMIAFLEHPDSNAHYHALLRFPKGHRLRPDEELKTVLSDNWKSTCPSGSTDVKRIDQKDGLYRYVTKHLSRGASLESFVVSTEFHRESTALREFSDEEITNYVRRLLRHNQTAAARRNPHF